MECIMKAYEAPCAGRWARRRHKGVKGDHRGQRQPLQRNRTPGGSSALPAGCPAELRRMWFQPRRRIDPLAPGLPRGILGQLVAMSC